MTQKTKVFKKVKFPYEVISEAYQIFYNFLPEKIKENRRSNRQIGLFDQSWDLDSDDQFLMEYKNEIRTARLTHYHYSEDNDSSRFAIEYIIGNTDVTISLPSISSIETVFKVFETNYEKYKQIDSININKPTKESEIEVKIPSTIVKRELITQLEEYILEKAREFDRFQRGDFEIIYHTRNGSHKLNSIKFFDHTYFPNDIEDLTLAYSLILELRIRIKFSSGKYQSTLNISYTGDNAPSVVESIRSDILLILMDHKTFNSFYHPPNWVWGILVSLTLIVFYMGFYLDDSLASAICWILTLIIVAYLSASAFKPYSILETKRNEVILRWNKFLVEGILGFLLFTIFGGLVLRACGIF